LRARYCNQTFLIIEEAQSLINFTIQTFNIFVTAVESLPFSPPSPPSCNDNVETNNMPSPASSDLSASASVHPAAATSGHRVVTSVLESLDPSSFLNTLQANQIDDLENALLPHLTNDEIESNSGNRMQQG
jgi:hypothetical protein